MIRRLAVLLLVILLLCLAYLGEASYMTAASYRLQQEHERREILTRQILQVQAEISYLDSPTRIWARAGKLGLLPAPPEAVHYARPSRWLAQWATLPQRQPAALSESGVLAHSPHKPAPSLWWRVARWWGDLSSQFRAWTALSQPVQP